MTHLPSWAIWSIAAAAALSPVLAFLLAIAVEILIDALSNAGVLEFAVPLAFGAIGCYRFRQLWGRSRARAIVET
jgi:hypothetical protein